MIKEGKSGKRVVAVLLGLVLAAALGAWYWAMKVEQRTLAGATEQGSDQDRVLSDGVVYEAHAGDPAVVTARDAASNEELWRTELGAIATRPVILIKEELIEVQVAGTPWMTLDRASGKPVE